MKKGQAIIGGGILLVFLIIALIIFLIYFERDNVLEFMVTDQVSEGWVWDLTVQLQDRVIRGFYQSDSGPTPFLFTHLETGTYQMLLSAPSYETVTVPVTIKSGRNILVEPIRMRGYELPDFQRFFVFTAFEGNDIILELRPVDSSGMAIQNHPCLDLWIGCRVYVQEKNGLPVQAPTDSGSVTGRLLFKGKIPWEWDSSPENIYRYTARLKGARLEKHNSPYRVYEYLIILPDPRKITAEELEREIKPLLEVEDLGEITARLELLKEDRYQYFLDVKWNVQALP